MSETIADKVREYFKVFPNLTFEQVEGFIPGLTIENFRMIKSRYKKKTGQEDDIKNNNNTDNKKKSNYYTIKNVKSNFHEQPDRITSLNPTSIEKLIKDKINNKSSVPDALIRMALDFLIKLKVTDSKNLQVDAKYLKLIKSPEGIDYQPGDKIDVELDMEEFQKLGVSIGESDGIDDPNSDKNPNPKPKETKEDNRSLEEILNEKPDKNELLFFDNF